MIPQYCSESTKRFCRVGYGTCSSISNKFEKRTFKFWKRNRLQVSSQHYVNIAKLAGSAFRENDKLRPGWYLGRQTQDIGGRREGWSELASKGLFENS